MAERAVASGRRIVLIGALPTALRQTADLLHRVASYGQRSLEMEEVLVPYAWPCFERGDTAGYLAYVRDAIESRARAGDVVVLAQASMAAVTEIYREPDVPVLSSPALGVAAAIAEYQSIVTARRQS